MSCTCDTRSPDPIESKGSELHRCEHCPECGEIGEYQGAGSTGVSNWGGRPFSSYYCPECDLTYKVYAPGRMAPTA